MSATSALAELLELEARETTKWEVPGGDGFVWIIVPSQARNSMDESGDEVDVAALRKYADAVLVLASIDPALGAWHVAGWGTTCVVLVTAGESSRMRLRATSQILRSAGLQLRSAVLLGADRDDGSIDADHDRPTLASESALGPVGP